MQDLKLNFHWYWPYKNNAFNIHCMYYKLMLQGGGGERMGLQLLTSLTGLRSSLDSIHQTHLTTLRLRVPPSIHVMLLSWVSTAQVLQEYMHYWHLCKQLRDPAQAQFKCMPVYIQDSCYITRCVLSRTACNSYFHTNTKATSYKLQGIDFQVHAIKANTGSCASQAALHSLTLETTHLISRNSTALAGSVLERRLLAAQQRRALVLAYMEMDTQHTNTLHPQMRGMSICNSVFKG